MNAKKQAVLYAGITIVGVGLFTLALWALYHNQWAALIILISFPVIASVLKLFYNYEFHKEVVSGLRTTFLIITVFSSLLYGLNKQSKSKFFNLFVEGDIKSKIVTTEADEGPGIFEERRYTFIPSNKENGWKLKVFDWVYIIILIGSPIITTKLLYSLKPKE